MHLSHQPRREPPSLPGEFLAIYSIECHAQTVIQMLQLFSLHRPLMCGVSDFRAILFRGCQRTFVESSPSTASQSAIVLHDTERREDLRPIFNLRRFDMAVCNRNEFRYAFCGDCSF